MQRWILMVVASVMLGATASVYAEPAASTGDTKAAAGQVTSATGTDTKETKAAHHRKAAAAHKTRRHRAAHANAADAKSAETAPKTETAK